MITLGGNAELELVDSMDPFSEGIIFSVMPPKKSWRNISNLSGGEKVLFILISLHTYSLTSSIIKTLSSLALVFALHVYKVCVIYPQRLVPSNVATHSQRHYTLWTRLMPL
jgi:structural maintenance of chromosome 4